MKQAYELAPDKRSEPQKSLVVAHEPTLKIVDADGAVGGSYRVIALNSVGLESAPSEPAETE